MIRFHCNNCQKKIGVPTQYAGRRVRCPSCQTAVRVPGTKGQEKSDVSVLSDLAGTPVELAGIETENQRNRDWHTNAYEVKRNLLGQYLVQYRCPSCGEELENPLGKMAGVRDECPSCGKPHVVPGQADREALEQENLERRRAAGKSIEASIIGDGRVSLQAPLPQAMDLCEKAMVECGVRIKQRGSTSLEGHSRYGINLFGMTVTATGHSSGPTTTIAFKASFRDAHDTVGACRRKVRKIADRLVKLAATTRVASDARTDATDAIAGRAADLVDATPLRVCPYCEGEISPNATKCRHCGEWLGHEGASTADQSVSGEERRGPSPAVVLTAQVLGFVVGVFVTNYVIAAVSGGDRTPIGGLIEMLEMSQEMTDMGEQLDEHDPTSATPLACECCSCVPDTMALVFAGGLFLGGCIGAGFGSGIVGAGPNYWTRGSDG